MQRDLRCRLAVPFVYVPRFYISWHWHPDPLARCSTLIPSSSRLLKWIAPAGNSVRAVGRRQIAFVKLGLV